MIAVGLGVGANMGHAEREQMNFPRKRCVTVMTITTSEPTAHSMCVAECDVMAIEIEISNTHHLEPIWGLVPFDQAFLVLVLVTRNT